ncbi:MAG TPA: lysozyme inhibitor LprI family protein [Vineibacter sp.]|nr:lysozyme inhibitor LprI family protein [Vineibacter sp.]
MRLNLAPLFVMAVACFGFAVDRAANAQTSMGSRGGGDALSAMLYLGMIESATPQTVPREGLRRFRVQSYSRGIFIGENGDEWRNPVLDGVGACPYPKIFNSDVYNQYDKTNIAAGMEVICATSLPPFDPAPPGEYMVCWRADTGQNLTAPVVKPLVMAYMSDPKFSDRLCTNPAPVAVSPQSTSPPSPRNGASQATIKAMTEGGVIIVDIKDGKLVSETGDQFVIWPLPMVCRGKQIDPVSLAKVDQELKEELLRPPFRATCKIVGRTFDAVEQCVLLVQTGHGAKVDDEIWPLVPAVINKVTCVDQVAAATPESTDANPDASFPCRAARTYFEKLICSNPALRSADREMGEAYQATRTKLAPAEKAKLEREQVQWLGQRGRSCGIESRATEYKGDAAALVHCLVVETKARSAAIAVASSAQP